MILLLLARRSRLYYYYYYTTTSTTVYCTTTTTSTVGLSVISFFSTLVKALNKIKTYNSLKFGILKNKSEDDDKSNEYYRKLKNLLRLSLAPTALGRGIFNSAADELRNFLGISEKSRHFKILLKKKISLIK